MKKIPEMRKIPKKKRTKDGRVPRGYLDEEVQGGVPAWEPDEAQVDVAQVCLQVERGAALGYWAGQQAEVVHDVAVAPVEAGAGCAAAGERVVAGQDAAVQA